MPNISRAELPPLVGLNLIAIHASIVVSRFVRVVDPTSSGLDGDEFQLLADHSYRGIRMSEHQGQVSRHESDVPYIIVMPEQAYPRGDDYATQHPRYVLLGAQYTEDGEKQEYYTSVELAAEPVYID